MRTGTRDKAVVQPVSLSSSRTKTWGNLPGSPARLCARFLARDSWCPGCVGGPGLWPSFPVLFVGLVPSCGSCPSASSGFVLRVCFKKEAMTRGTDPKTGFFLTDRPREERALRGGRSEERRPEDRSFGRYPFLRTSLQWYWWWLLGTYFGLFPGFFFLRLLLFRSSVQPTGGGWWKNLHV